MNSSGATARSVGVGEVVPDRALIDHRGDPWRFSDHRGTPILAVLHRHLA